VNWAFTDRSYSAVGVVSRGGSALRPLAHCGRRGWPVRFSPGDHPGPGKL